MNVLSVSIERTKTGEDQLSEFCKKLHLDDSTTNGILTCRDTLLHGSTKYEVETTRPLAYFSARDIENRLLELGIYDKARPYISATVTYLNDSEIFSRTKEESREMRSDSLEERRDVKELVVGSYDVFQTEKAHNIALKSIIWPERLAKY